jgi:PTH2 family peptidyl-tRNA hydrolase
MYSGSVEAKQVIVMRTDLGMRKGKMVAQGAHASIAWLTELLRVAGHVDLREGLTDAQRAWVEGDFVKVCVRVDSEEELRGVRDRAVRAGVQFATILDAGRTEFHGVPTLTCLAVGPDWADRVDAVTGELRLL